MKLLKKKSSFCKKSQVLIPIAFFIAQISLDITPSFYYFNRTHDHDLIVMELKGSNLYDLFENFNRKFSLKTVVLIGLNLVKLELSKFLIIVGNSTGRVAR